MADLTSNVVANAVFRIGATSTLELNNTGTFPAGVIFKKSVLLPSGVIRTATGASATVQLPFATDGTVQTGLYVITETVNDGVQDSSLIRPFILTLNGLQPALTIAEDYTLPSFIFTDTQTYVQPGYSIQSIVRAWSAVRGDVTAASYTGTSPVFDIAQSGVYYQSEYTVKEAAVVTYQRSTAPWATVVVTYTATQVFSPSIFPVKSTLLNWIGAVDGDNCGCEDDNSSACIYKLLTDYYCAGNTAQAFRQVGRLYRETHYKQAYRPLYNGQALTGVTYCVGVTTPIRIVTQPMGGTLVAGVLQLAVVVAGGTAPYTYQWYKGGVAIAGATSAGFTATSAATYYVIATDSLGATVTSDSAVVAVPALQITQQPQNVSVNEGDTATFTTLATGGTTPYSYQWYVIFPGQQPAAIPSAVNSSFTTGALQVSNSGQQYLVIITDAVGDFVTSQNATLTVQSVTVLKARIGFAPNGTDPFVNGTTAPANITYLPYVIIANPNDAITIAKNTADYAKLADNYIVLEMSTGIGDRTLVANGGLGPYTIPAQEFARISVSNGLKYIVSNNPWTLSLNDDLVFTH